MSDTMNNPAGSMRCVRCGQIDAPILRATKPGWLALALWALAGLIWAIGFAVATAWLSYVAAVAFLLAFLYTLRYFFQREKACRHCGGRDLEVHGGAAAS